jgi:glycosyltransferase involved in cell wall biosynthesis
MNKEAVISGSNGLLYKVATISSLHEAMLCVYENYDEAILRGKTARAVALQKYDIREVALQYEAIIKSQVIKKNS